MSSAPVIVPPFDEQSALRKVQLAQDAWNTRDPAGVALAYTEDSRWRNRDEFFQGRDAIRAFLGRKWARELDCDPSGQWWRSHGNEHWELDETSGLMRRRDASINDYRIAADQRRIAVGPA